MRKTVLSGLTAVGMAVAMFAGPSAAWAASDKDKDKEKDDPPAVVQVDPPQEEHGQSGDDHGGSAEAPGHSDDATPQESVEEPEWTPPAAEEPPAAPDLPGNSENAGPPEWSQGDGNGPGDEQFGDGEESAEGPGNSENAGPPEDVPADLPEQAAPEATDELTPPEAADEESALAEEGTPADENGKKDDKKTVEIEAADEDPEPITINEGHIGETAEDVVGSEHDCEGLTKDGMDAWVFVLPGNDAQWVTLSVKFEEDGTITEFETIGGGEANQKAVMYTPSGWTIESGSATITGGTPQDEFQLTHACPGGPGTPPPPPPPPPPPCCDNPPENPPPDNPPPAGPPEVMVPPVVDQPPAETVEQPVVIAAPEQVPEETGTSLPVTGTPWGLMVVIGLLMATAGGLALILARDYKIGPMRR